MAYVFYSGVTTEDVLFARGKLHSCKEHFGLVGHEFSGTCGERRIMGLVEKGGISLQLNIDPHYSWEIPNHWSLQDAATVPVAYSLVSRFLCRINYEGRQNRKGQVIKSYRK